MLPYQRVIAYTHILRVRALRERFCYLYLSFVLDLNRKIQLVDQKLVRWTWESHEDYCRIMQVLKTLEDTLANNVHLRLLPSEKKETAMGTQCVYIKIS